MGPLQLIAMAHLMLKYIVSVMCQDHAMWAFGCDDVSTACCEFYYVLIGALDVNVGESDFLDAAKNILAVAELVKGALGPTEAEILHWHIYKLYAVAPRDMFLYVVRNFHYGYPFKRLLRC